MVASFQRSLFPEPILFHAFSSETGLKSPGHPGQVSLKSSVVDAKNEESLGMETSLCNPYDWEAEAGRSPVWQQPELHSKAPASFQKEKGRGSSVLLTPLKMEAWPCFLPSWSYNLSINKENQSCKVDLLTLELENISPAYLQHQWPKADLAELISRETNQLEKMQICFLHRVGNSLYWTTPWIKFRAELRIWVR